MLMPPDMRGWLPDDHLAWFVIDFVEQIDLAAFYCRHRDDGWGRAAFDPRMMVTLLLYAYSMGVRSAREIERRLIQDVAFRVIAANRQIDHATVCRFRGRHRDALAELFVEVLSLCAKAGMVRPGVVAIDGTKLGANASAAHNLTRDQLEELARRVFEEAEDIDAREDELYGDKRGDELPEHLHERAARIEWLRRKLAERQRELDDQAVHPKSKSNARVNTTDPDSALLRTRSGYIQGYNAQAAVSTDHFVVAADITQDNNDFAMLRPMVDEVKDNLRAADIDDPLATVVADYGYFSDANAGLEVGVNLLLAPVATSKLPEAVANREPLIEFDEAALRTAKRERLWGQRQAARREEIVNAYGAKHITAREAAQVLEVSVAYIYELKWEAKRLGRSVKTMLPAPPPRPAPTHVMLERFSHPGALATYAMRATTVEPVFGQLKEARGMRRFLHRGREACRAEWRMMTSAHNLRRLWTCLGASRPLLVTWA